LWGYDGTNVFEYGSNSFLNQTGGTVNGNLEITGNLSASTIFSADTNLEEYIITENKIIDLYQSGTTATSGGTGTFNSLPWDSIGISGGLYTHTLSDIVINFDGVYKIEYSVSLDRTAGGRSIGVARVMKDSGGGFLFVPGSQSFTYNRTTTSGEGTANKSVTRRFVGGDIIKIEFGIHQGGGSLETIADASNITITRVSR